MSRDLKNRYRGTILGIAWSLVTPLGLVAIIGTVFSLLWGISMKVFVPYLFSGLIPWLYISACAQGGTTSFISAQGYIKQTQTPIEIFPIRTALVEFTNLLFGLGAFFIVYLFISPENFNYFMLMVVPALIIWLVFGISLATLAALINTHIRDYAPLQGLIIQGFFYVTPIVWKPDILAEKNYGIIYQLNPIYYMLEIIRRPLLGEMVTDFHVWTIALGITLLLACASVLFTIRIGRKITFKL